MHLETEEIQRALHGELAASSSRASAHLADCDACRSSVEQARAEEARIFSLLSAIDQPSSMVDIEAVRRLARRPVTSWSRVRWAASIVAAVGFAGIAFALPASPLRQWIDRLRAPARLEPAPRPAELPRSDENIGGVSIAPGSDGSTLVIFTASQERGEARVVLADVDDISVRSQSGAARFAVAPGRLTIDNGGVSADYEIIIPRAAPRVEIRIAGERVWLKDGVQVETSFSGAPTLIPMHSTSRPR